MSTTAELSAKMLTFTEISSEVGAEAKKFAEEALAVCKEARPLVDKLADALVQDSHVAEDERNEAVKLASTHIGTLKLASNLLRHIRKEKQANGQQESQTRLGKGVPDSGREKSASASTNSVFVGRRAGLGEKRASDVALLRGLGIDPGNVAG